MLYFWHYGLEIKNYTIVLSVLVITLAFIYVILSYKVSKNLDEEYFDKHFPNNKVVAKELITKPRKLLWIPGEDGLFPLAAFFLGHGFLWCALFGALFGFYHFKNHTIKQCAIKAVILVVALYFILPFGIETWLLSHLLFDMLIATILTIIAHMDISEVNKALKAKDAASGTLYAERF